MPKKCILCEQKDEEIEQLKLLLQKNRKPKADLSEEEKAERKAKAVEKKEAKEQREAEFQLLKDENNHLKEELLIKFGVNFL